MSDKLMLISLLFGEVGKPYGNVIDIEDNSTTKGTALDAYPPKVHGAPLGGTTTFAANQTWEIQPDPAGSSHHIIKNPATGFCIDIKASARTPGAVLQTYPVKSTNNANQLWDFLPDSFGSGACLIQNPQTGLVIEIEDGSNEAGAPLVLGRRRVFDNNRQLWAGLLPDVGNNYGTTLAAARLPALTFQAPPAPFGGNQQYAFLAPNQNEPFTSLSVTLDVIEDLVIGAFTVQINANAPAPARNPSQPVTPANDAGSGWDAQWLQYILAWQDNQFSLLNQFYHQTGPEPQDPLPSFPGFARVPTSASFTDNTIPAGIRIILALTIDGTQRGRVTAISASIYQNGAPIGSGSLLGPGQQSFHQGVRPVRESDLAPFGAFQVVVAGHPDDFIDNFAAGMGTLTINCRPACTVSTGPDGIDPLSTLMTGESTNCYYGELQAGSFQQLVQPFGVPRPRVTGVSPGPGLLGEGFYPNSALLISGVSNFPESHDSVPLDVSSVSTAADGSFGFGLKWHWASADEEKANDSGAAEAIVDVKVTDAQGNSVTAQLATGVPAPHVVSSSVLLGGLPAFPTDVSASNVAHSHTTASVSFTAPVLDGGLPITYKVSASSSNAPAPSSMSGPQSPVTVTGLTPGGVYTFIVTPYNAFGQGQGSAPSNAITA